MDFELNCEISDANWEARQEALDAAYLDGVLPKRKFYLKSIPPQIPFDKQKEYLSGDEIEYFPSSKKIKRTCPWIPAPEFDVTSVDLNRYQGDHDHE